MKRILTRDRTGTTLYHEQTDGSVVIQSVTDVEPVLDQAKERHNIGAHTTRMGDKHVASIPIAVLQMWARQKGKEFGDVMRDPALMDEFLNDPDHSAWRIWRGN